MMRRVAVFRDQNHLHFHHHHNWLITKPKHRCIASYQQLSRSDNTIIMLNNNRLNYNHNFKMDCDYRLSRSRSISLNSSFSRNGIGSSGSRLYSSNCSRYNSNTTSSSGSSCDSSDSNSVGVYSTDINDYLKDPHPKFNVPRGMATSSSLSPP